MRSDIEEKVIKPPVKRVTSGKIFKPSKAFLHKRLLQPTVAAVIIWLITVLAFIGMSFVAASAEPENFPSAVQHINAWIGPVSFWAIVLNMIWLIPLLIYTPLYFRSIEFSVKAETGETMPEVYVKKGVITDTRKHVPFRTI
ncbi:MAG: hypothetical protein ACETV1_08535, partial [Candidatus Bathyarchaeia archaeon]